MFLRSLLRRPLLAGLLALSAALAAPRARANTFTVTSSMDGPMPGTLQGAINAANALGGSHTINFGPMVLLPTGVTEFRLNTPLPDINCDLTITGPGADKLMISGPLQGGRIFKINASRTVTITGLWLTQGKVEGASSQNAIGGAIYNAGSLTVRDMFFSQNQAKGGAGTKGSDGAAQAGTGGADGLGGAIYSDGTQLTVERCCFHDNSALGGIGGAGGNDGGAGIAGSGAGGVGGAGRGGAIYVASGGASIVNTTLAANKATGGTGGAGGLTGTTPAQLPGGAGGNVEGAGIGAAVAVSVTSSTVVQNEAKPGLGGPQDDGTTRAAAGTASGAGVKASGTVTMGNSLVALNVAVAPATTTPSPQDVTGFFSSRGFNLVGVYDANTASGINGATDQVGSAAQPLNPRIDPAGLAANNAAVPSVGLTRQSPALDKGKDLDATGADGRGLTRPFNFDNALFPNATGGDGSDIGAFEAQTLPNAAPTIPAGQIVSGRAGVAFVNKRLNGVDPDGDTLTYTLVSDHMPLGLTLNSDGTVTGTPDEAIELTITFKVSDGKLESAPATAVIRATEAASLVVNTTVDDSTDMDEVTSLREAIAYAQVDGANTPVTFDPVVFAKLRTIVLDSGINGIAITSDVEVNAPNAGLVIDGGGGRIFPIGAGTVTLRRLTLANGAGTGLGGAVSVVSGVTANFIACTFQGNGGAGRTGGAIGNLGGTVTLTSCTLAGNSATGASAGGGAIYQSAGSLTLHNCTLSANSATGGSGGGLWIDGGTLSLGNTIVAGNTAATGPDIAGSAASLGYNLIGDATGATISGDTATNLTGVAAGLDPEGLGFNGGPTPTIALLPTSAARDQGKAFGGVTTDQRGKARVADSSSIANASGGDGSDMGAFEFSGTGPEIAVSTGGDDLPAGSGLIDFGTKEVGSATDVVFTIRNKGTADLNLTASPRVAITGTDKSQFTVTEQPAVAKLAPGATTTFTVRFGPKSSGDKSAAISIASNDPDENPFQVSVGGSVDDTVTVAPTIISPLTDGFVYPKASIVYQLPEAAKNGTVKVTFSNGVDYGFTLPADAGTAGSHTVTVDTAAAGMAQGTYTLSLSYQDAEGHLAASALQTNITIRAAKAVSDTEGAIGDAAAGAGTNGLPADAVLDSFGVPATDDFGDLAYVAKWSASGGLTGTGLFLNDYCLGVRDGDYPNLTGATYASFTDPVVSAGKVLTIAGLAGTPTPPSSVVLVYDAGTNPPTAIAAVGDIAPNAAGTQPVGGDTFASFSTAAIEGDSVAVFAKLSGGTVTDADDTGLWMLDATHSLRLVLREGQTLGSRTISTITAFLTGAGSGGQGRGWLSLNSSGDPRALALVKFTDNSQAVVSADFGNAATILADTGVSGTGGPAITGATFASLGLPAVNSAAHSAMLAKLTVATGISTNATAQGVFFDGGAGTFEAVARLGSLAGRTRAKFSVLKDPVLADDDGLAFFATLAGLTVSGPSTQTLWWRPPGGVLTLLAQGGKRPGPDLPSTAQWESFSSLGIAAGRGPVFVGKMIVGLGGVTTANADGVWATDFSGAPRLLFRTGMKVGGKTLKKFTVLKAAVGSVGVTRSINNVQEVVWQATFTDGSTAILTSEVP